MKWQLLSHLREMVHPFVAFHGPFPHIVVLRSRHLPYLKRAMICLLTKCAASFKAPTPPSSCGIHHSEGNKANRTHSYAFQPRHHCRSSSQPGNNTCSGTHRQPTASVSDLLRLLSPLDAQLLKGGLVQIGALLYLRIQPQQGGCVRCLFCGTLTGER